jgi:hypothetical protein
MDHNLAIAAAHLEWALYAAPLLVGALPEVVLLIQRRGFGRRRGSFGLFRLMFVLMFTTVLGPILLAALIAFVAYRFFAGRRTR